MPVWHWKKYCGVQRIRMSNRRRDKAGVCFTFCTRIRKAATTADWNDTRIYVTLQCPSALFPFVDCSLFYMSLHNVLYPSQYVNVNRKIISVSKLLEQQNKRIMRNALRQNVCWHLAYPDSNLWQSLQPFSMQCANMFL